MGYSGARGKLIYEKSLNAKISCQTPLTALVSRDGKEVIIEDLLDTVNNAYRQRQSERCR